MVYPMVFYLFTIAFNGFAGYGPLVKRCNGCDGSLWSNGDDDDAQVRLGGSSHLLFQLPPTTQHSLRLVKLDNFDDYDDEDDDDDDDDADDDDDDDDDDADDDDNMMMISFLQANTHWWYLNMTAKYPSS